MREIVESLKFRVVVVANSCKNLHIPIVEIPLFGRPHLAQCFKCGNINHIHCFISRLGIVNKHIHNLRMDLSCQFCKILFLSYRFFSSTSWFYLFNNVIGTSTKNTSKVCFKNMLWWTLVFIALSVNRHSKKTLVIHPVPLLLSWFVAFLPRPTHFVKGI